MKTKFTFIYCLLWLTSFTIVKAQTITIDGTFSDWDAVPYAHTNTTGTGGRLIALKTFGTATHLYFMVEGTTDMDFGTLLAHLDTDNNPATGYNNSWQYGAGAGSDYRLEGNAPWWGGLYQHSGNPADDWAGFTQIESLGTSPNPSPVHSRSSVVETGGKKYFEFSITKSYLGTLGAFINIAIYDTTNPSTGAIPAIDDPDPTVAKYLQIPTIGGSTLPVTLASFKASATTNAVQLSWSTHSEQNNSHFELYKSLDGSKFEKIATIKGAGNSNSQLFYNYTDYSLSGESVYYQLKQIDLNGDVASLGIVEVKSKLKKTQFSVYKVPGQDILEIKVHTDKNGSSRFLLSDVSGKVLTNKTIQLVAGSQIIRVSLSTKSGIYIAALNTSEGLLSQKILIAQ